MQQRRGTEEQWELANPVLAAGEIGWASDVNKFKVGDGINSWGDLSYFVSVDDLEVSIDDFIPLTQKGAADGVATLDSSGQVPANQLGNATVDLAGYATETYVDTAVSGLVDAAPGLLDTLNELAAAIGDDENFATTINNSISSGDSATLAAAEDYADGLAVNYDPAGAASAAEAAANLYTDNAIAAIPPIDLTGYATETYVDTAVGNIDLSSKQDVVAGVSDTEIGYLANVTSDIQTQLNNKLESSDLNGYATETYADQAEADAKSYADGLAVNYDPAGAASAAEAAANLYTDNAIAAIPPTDLTGYATEIYVDTAVSNLVDSAPAALDTLNELAAALGDDENFATSVTNALAGKADTNHTHLLADVTDITASAAELNILDGVTASTTELNYVDGVTSSIQTQLDEKLESSDLAGYATETYVNNSISGLASESYVDSAIDNVVGLAPETLNTLAELADALGDNPAAITTLQSDVADLQSDKADTNSPTFTGLTDFQGIVDFSDAVVVGLETVSATPHPFSMIG
jgi:hypothetical protein